MTRMTDEQADRMAALEREVERAYQVLEIHGVPRDRAKSVGNGIDVLTTRLGRQVSDLEREVAELRGLVKEFQDRRWQIMATAPKTGPVQEVLLYVKRAGTYGVVIGHWAYGGGEEQPAFGPGWFFWTGWDFSGLKEEPLAWMALPTYERESVQVLRRQG